MGWVTLLTLCTLPAVTHSLTYVQAAEVSADRTLSGSAGLLNTLEADIARIWDALHGSHSKASLVQLSSEDSAQPVVAAKPAGKVTLHKKKGIDAATAVKEMDGLKLGAPMLGLLDGMYENWKEKIGEANKKEHEQKVSFDKTIADLEVKKAKSKDSKDGAETYDRIEKYWKRQRAISHRQYHTALKIMHSGMQKFKSVSSAMKNAIAGKKPNAQDLHTVGLAMPDVVFLQQEVQHLVAWTQVAAKDLRGAKVFTN